MRLVKSQGDGGPVSFEQGDYHRVVLDGEERWETCAALGLLGLCERAAAGFVPYQSPESEFHRAANEWIAGRDGYALSILQGLDSPEAKTLSALIGKDQIRVLAQLPWTRGGPQTLLQGIEGDPKFTVVNHSFHADDRPVEPYASVFDWFRTDELPDFYICNMLEWHHPPIDIEAAPFPVFAQTADLDYHSQAIRRWLPAFDAILVSDHTEHAMVARMADGTDVLTVPSCFGWRPGPNIPSPHGDRPFDVFVSGTLFRPYHPDKADLLIRILKSAGINAFFMEAHVDYDRYRRLMAQSKTTICYYRNQGGMITRGIDAITLGTIPIIPKNNIFKHHISDEYYVEYAPDFGDIVEAVSEGLRRFDGLGIDEATAQSRLVFDPVRTSSRYFRALTVLAALYYVKGSRRYGGPQRDHRRIVQHRGWPIGDPTTANNFLASNHRRFVARLKVGWSTSVALLLSREYLLSHAEEHRVGGGRRPHLKYGLKILKLAIQRDPNRLVPYFNFIRAAYHYGNEAEREEAADLLDDALMTPVDDWEISIHDDVMPYDFLETSLDYRSYLDLLVSIEDGGNASAAEPITNLKKIILASLHWLAGHMRDRLEDYARARELNEADSLVALDFAVNTLAEAKPRQLKEAEAALRQLADGSYLFQQAASIIVQNAPRFGKAFSDAEIGEYARLTDCYWDRIVTAEADDWIRSLSSVDARGWKKVGNGIRPSAGRKKGMGLVLAEFDAPFVASARMTEHIEGLPFAEYVRISPFLRPDMVNPADTWKTVAGNQVCANLGHLLNWAVLNMDSDTVLVTRDPIALFGDEGIDLEVVAKHLSDDATVVIGGREPSPFPRVLGVAFTRKRFLGFAGAEAFIYMKGIFDWYDFPRRQHALAEKVICLSQDCKETREPVIPPAGAFGYGWHNRSRLLSLVDSNFLAPRDNVQEIDTLFRKASIDVTRAIRTDYEVTASSTYPHEDHSIDNLKDTSQGSWAAATPVSFPQIIEARFPEPRSINMVLMQSQSGHPERAPKRLTIDGCLDGGSWRVLKEIKDTGPWGSNEWKRICVSDADPIRRIRLTVHANQGDPGFLSIRCLAFIGETAGADQPGTAPEERKSAFRRFAQMLGR